MKNAVFVQRICIHIYAISKTYSGVRSYLDITVNNMQYGNRVCQRCLYSQWWCLFDISCISLHIWSLLQNVDTCNTLSTLPNHRWGKNKSIFLSKFFLKKNCCLRIFKKYRSNIQIYVQFMLFYITLTLFHMVKR